MREKFGLAALAVVLVLAWGGGFLWFRGQGSDDPTSAAKARTSPTASASTSPGASESPSKSPSKSLSPTASVSASVPAVTSPLDQVGPVDANPVAPRPRPRVLPPVAEFSMASFNVLGSSHTKNGGRGRASGPARMNGVLSILAQHDISVAGFQEFQPNQRSTFRARAGGWEMFPGEALGRGAGENSVVWRTDTWDVVETRSVSIPYFHGRARPMPYVLLRHKATGISAWFSTFHNPADVYGGAQKYRNTATSREITLFNQLEQTGIPQFVTGDMNERAEYFCRITGATPLIAAHGGSNNGRCLPPRPTQIDWIFGSPGVTFSDFVIDKSATVRRTTDHPVVVSKVAIDALKYEKAFQPGAEATQPPG